MQNPIPTTLKNHFTQNRETIVLVAKTTAALTAIVGVAGVYVLVKQNQTKSEFIEVNGMTEAFTAFITE